MKNTKKKPHFVHRNGNKHKKNNFLLIICNNFPDIVDFTQEILFLQHITQ